MSLWLRTFLFMLLTLCFSQAHSACAEEKQISEQQVKSAIVYNIARYVTWPVAVHGDNTLFTIGIFGQGVSAWGTLPGKMLSGRKIVVRRITDIDDLVNCQIVYIDSSEKKNLPRILTVLKEIPVLTISEIEGFSHSGGMIALRVINNRIKFDVNLKSTRASGLDISSNLLRLASEVVK